MPGRCLYAQCLPVGNSTQPESSKRQKSQSVAKKKSLKSVIEYKCLIIQILTFCNKKINKKHCVHSGEYPPMYQKAADRQLADKEIALPLISNPKTNSSIVYTSNIEMNILIVQN